MKKKIIDSISITDGTNVPEYADAFIKENNQIETSVDYQTQIKPDTLTYLENCFNNSFQLFEKKILDIYNKDPRFLIDHNIRYTLKLGGNFTNNQNCYEKAFYNATLMKQKEPDSEMFISELSNSRNLYILNHFSVLKDVYQFVFLLKSYIHRGLFIKEKPTDFYSFIYRNMPSYFFIEYRDEGCDFEEATLMFILADMLSRDKKYQTLLLNYAKENDSLNNTDQNDIGDILQRSETPLKYIDCVLKSDSDFANNLLAIDPYLLMYLGNDLRNNKTIVKSVYESYLKKPNFGINYSSGMFCQSAYGFLFEGIGDELKKDLVFMNPIPELQFDEDKYRKEMNPGEEMKQNSHTESDSDLPF